MSVPFRPLFVDAEAAIESDLCRCRILCTCHKSRAAWERLLAEVEPNEFRRRQMLLNLELRGLALGLSDLLD